MVGCFVGDPVGGEDCHGNSFFTVLSLQDGNFQFLHLECHKTPSTSPAVCKGDPFILAGIAGVCSQDMLDFWIVLRWLRIELIHSWISKILLVMFTNEPDEINIDAA